MTENTNRATAETTENVYKENLIMEMVGKEPVRPLMNAKHDIMDILRARGGKADMQCIGDIFLLGVIYGRESAK